MAQSTQIQATCLLLLLIASLTSSSTILQQLVRQPEALQPWHRTEAKADTSVLIPERRKRDTNFPLCVYCCNCCKPGTCGYCCKF